MTTRHTVPAAPAAKSARRSSGKQFRATADDRRWTGDVPLSRVAVTLACWVSALTVAFSFANHGLSGIGMWLALGMIAYSLVDLARACGADAGTDPESESTSGQ